MTDHDERISRRYAELAREEPGAAIDAAILGASRRALARTSWSRRWAGPVSIAAVLVLSVGVTLQMQREQPGIERPESPPPQAKSAAPEPQAPVELDKDRAAERQDSVAPAPEKKPIPPAKLQKLERYAEPKPFADALAPRAREEAGAMAPSKESQANVAPRAREEAPAPPASADARPGIQAARPPAVTAASAARAAAPAQAPAPMQAPAETQKSLASQAPAPAMAPLGTIASRAKRDAAESAPQAARLQAARTEEEVELERIAKLRAEGHGAEADKALEEFRRKYPVYRIPEATWERVKPR